MTQSPWGRPSWQPPVQQPGWPQQPAQGARPTGPPQQQQSGPWGPPQGQLRGAQQARPQQVGQLQQPWGQQQPQAHWGPPQGLPDQRYYRPVQVPPRKRGGFGRVLMLAVVVIIVGWALRGVMSGIGGADVPEVPAGDYMNEDYRVPSVDTNPPPLPQPQTYGEARVWLTDNVFYNQTTNKPIRCEMGDIDFRTASVAQTERHLNAMMECLMRFWGPPIETASYTPVRPSVTVYSQPITTRCGESGMRNASYCGADQQVYVARDVLTVVPSELQSARYMVETVLAHEFGHAIQGRTGILISELALEDRETSKSASLELSRRLEVQADCFAGMFMSSIAQSTNMTDQDLAQIGRLGYSIGDDVLSGNPNIESGHGVGASRQYWMELGLDSSAVSACNTFTAPANRVR